MRLQFDAYLGTERVFDLPVGIGAVGHPSAGFATLFRNLWLRWRAARLGHQPKEAGLLALVGFVTVFARGALHILWLHCPAVFPF